MKKNGNPGQIPVIMVAACFFFISNGLQAQETQNPAADADLEATESRQSKLDQEDADEDDELEETEEELNEVELEDPFKPRYIVESIEVRGNDKTRGRLVISYIPLKPGETLDEEKVEIGRIRLLSLGYFRDVRMVLEKGSERGRVKLVVEVKERNTIIIDDLFMGYSQTNPFWGGLGMSDINFLGRGLMLSGAFVASEHQHAFRLGLYWPRIFNSKVNAGIQGIFSSGREMALASRIQDSPIDGCDDFSDFDQTLSYLRAGGIVTAGFQVDRANRISFDLHVEHIDADINEPEDDNGNSCDNYPFAGYLAPGRNGHSTLSSFTFRFERDTRDDFFLPTSGMYLAISIELATRILGSDYEFSKYMIQYEHSFPMWLDHAIRFSVVGGLIQDVGTWGSPFFSRFYIGDHALFLVNKYSLPRNLELNFSEVTDYGDLLASFNIEYDIPLWSTGDFFYRGYTYFAVNFSYITKAEFLAIPDEWSGRPKRPVSLDLGFKFDTPIGLFTLSLGYAMDLAL